MNKTRVYWVASVVAIWMLVTANSTFAAGLQISPVRITLSGKQRIQAFTITNTTNKAMVLQGEIMAWKQSEEDEYTASKDLILAPPIVSIPPGKSQIFRIALRNYQASEEEASYRIYLQEVISKLERDKAGLHFALRIGLPVFVAPLHPMPKKVQWAVKNKSAEILITAKNLGNTHVQISHLLLVDETSRKLIVDKTVFRYLLPGKSYTWKLKTKDDVKSFMNSIKISQLKAKTDGGVLNSSVTVS